jgi:hypothetical protein
LKEIPEVVKKDAAEILWQGDNAVIYKDRDGSVWRYLASYNQRWPVWTVKADESGKPFQRHRGSGSRSRARGK